jgi:hypothetical protein
MSRKSTGHDRDKRPVFPKQIVPDARLARDNVQNGIIARRR